MDREALIKQLDSNFLLVPRQEKDRGGRGYRFLLRASWNPVADVRSYRVQLVGTDPLTGANVEEENITALFSFDQKEYQTNTLLTYHGRFSLRCTAVLTDGEQVVFRNQIVDLSFPENKPEIVYTVKESRGFRLIEFRSNCWGNCRGKVWVSVDGHEQRVDLPAGSSRTVRFYVRAEGKLKITVQDKNVLLREGR